MGWLLQGEWVGWLVGFNVEHPRKVMPAALPDAAPPGFQNPLVQASMAWLWLIYRPGTWPVCHELCHILLPHSS